MWWLATVCVVRVCVYERACVRVCEERKRDVNRKRERENNNSSVINMPGSVCILKALQIFLQSVCHEEFKSSKTTVGISRVR